jgi:Leucine-rich repeat (LRR) protein
MQGEETPSQVLSIADLVGIITSTIHDGDDELDDDTNDRGRATRAHSLCLTSKPVYAAVLASVQRVRMDAVLQRMASLVSLRVGPGPLDHCQLPQLTSLRADGVSSPQALSAIMQLTRLQELRLDIVGDDPWGAWCALHDITRLTSLSSLGLSFPRMQQLPDVFCQLAALSSLRLEDCRCLQQLPNAISQLTSLTSLHLHDCCSLQQLPSTIDQLAALSSLHLEDCHSLQQLPSSIGQLAALTSLQVQSCSRLQQLPDTIGQLTALSCLDLSDCSSLHLLPDSIGQLRALTRLDLHYCRSLPQLPAALERTPIRELDLRGCTGLAPLPSTQQERCCRMC